MEKIKQYRSKHLGYHHSISRYCEYCIKIGIQQEQKRIIEIIERTLKKYPRQYNYWHPVVRELRDIKQQIQSQETKQKLSLSNTSDSSPDTPKDIKCKRVQQIQDEKKQ